jgi:hypothetical protein
MEKYGIEFHIFPILSYPAFPSGKENPWKVPIKTPK